MFFVLIDGAHFVIRFISIFYASERSVILRVFFRTQIHRKFGRDDYIGRDDC